MLKKIIIFIILLLALFLRLYHLTTLPPALYSDEVDAGYQAAIFNQNHTDYFGNKFPFTFHSFSDYRTGIYIYAIAFFQKLTNNWELSVRLPSVFFSLLSIIAIYLVTGSLAAAFLLAISPWSIHYGRTGFEAVSGMIFVILLGIYFFKRYLSTSKIHFLLLSSLFFCLSPYFYSTAKFFLIIIFVLVLIIWFKEIIKIPRSHFLIAGVFTLLVLTPFFIDTLNGKSGFRFSYINIFTAPHREQITDALRYEDIFSSNIGKIGVPTPFLSFVFHNKYQLIWEKFVNNYISSFSTDFLFLTGDTNLRQGFGGFGMLYYLDFFFVPFGIYLYTKKKTKLGTLFFWLLLLAPIPFALTRDSLSPHSTRLILMLPSFIYFASLTLKKLPIFVPVYLIFLFTFWHYYQFHYPQLSARSWHTGMKEAVLSATNLNASSIVFSDKSEPFLPFFLFYTRFLPSDAPVKHLSPVSNQSFSGQTLDNKYYFGNVNFANLSDLPQRAVFVVPKSEFVNTNQSKFTQIGFIPKTYIEQEEFYLLKLNE